MPVTVRAIGETVLLEVVGPLTFNTDAEQLRETVRRVLDEGRQQFVLNLAGVPSIDSAGLGELLRLYAAVARRGGALKLVRPSGPVRLLLDTAKLSTVFDCYDDEESAVADAKDHAVGILGAGGHAKVAIGILRGLNVPIFGAFDDDPARWGTQVLGVPIRAGLASDLLIGRPAVIAVGDNAARRRLAEGRPLRWRSCIHPSASVDPSATIGVGVVICSGAVVQPDARIGDHAIINTGATVDHDCTVGAYAHLCPGVHLAGGVIIEDGAFLGTGARVIPRVRVGAWAVVGAGATVLTDLPAAGVYVGTPARPRVASLTAALVAGHPDSGADGRRNAVPARVRHIAGAAAAGEPGHDRPLASSSDDEWDELRG